MVEDDTNGCGCNTGWFTPIHARVPNGRRCGIIPAFIYTLGGAQSHTHSFIDGELMFNGFLTLNDDDDES